MHVLAASAPDPDYRGPLSVLGAIALLCVLLVALGGCASLGKAVDGIEKGAMVVDILLDEEAEHVDQFVTGEIARCEALHPDDLGGFDQCIAPAEKYQRAFKGVVEAAVPIQEAAFKSLGRLREQVAELERLRDSARSRLK